MKDATPSCFRIVWLVRLSPRKRRMRNNGSVMERLVAPKSEGTLPIL